MSDIMKREDLPLFTDKEYETLAEHLEKDGSRISASVAANFLSLFLEGQTVDQIHRNFPQWPKGALLLARRDYNWDVQKANYVNDMVVQIKDRLIKAKVDVVNHLIDNLAVCHKEFSREMSLYLQSPKPENLPKNRIKSQREYKEVLAALQAALVLGEPTKGAVGTAIQINAAEGSVVKITAGEHSEALKQLTEEKK